MLVSQFTKERLGAASAVAASLECRFGTSYAASDIVMTAGADSAINALMDLAARRIVRSLKIGALAWSRFRLTRKR